jgi:hypothetical protein
MTSNRLFRTALLGAALALSACATTRPRTETFAAQRQRDTAPDRSAALRAATPGLGLEAEDQRWGIEAAKERRRARDIKAIPPQPAPDGRGGVDIKAP